MNYSTDLIDYGEWTLGSGASISGWDIILNGSYASQTLLLGKNESESFEIDFTVIAIPTSNLENKISLTFYYENNNNLFEAENAIIDISELGKEILPFKQSKKIKKIEINCSGKYTISSIGFFAGLSDTAEVSIATHEKVGVIKPSTDFGIDEAGMMQLIKDYLELKGLGIVDATKKKKIDLSSGGIKLFGATEEGSEKGNATIIMDNGVKVIQNLSNNIGKTGWGVDANLAKLIWLDPKDGKWKDLQNGYGGNIGNVIFHKDQTTLTNADLSNTNALHVGYSSTGNKIVGENSTIYLDGIVKLGVERVTKAQPIDPVANILYDRGVIKYQFTEEFGGGNATKGEVFYNSDHIYMYAMADSSSASEYLYITTIGSNIDLTPYKKLKVEANVVLEGVVDTARHGFSFGVGALSSGGNLVTYYSTSGTQVVEQDITNLKGYKTVTLKIGGGYTQPQKSVKAYIYKVWLE